jgi:hypothetical protein
LRGSLGKRDGCGSPSHGPGEMETREAIALVRAYFCRANRIALGDYFIGKNLNGNRPNLMQTSQSIVKKIGSDTLPGITAAKVTRLKNQRAAWIAAHKAQGQSESDAQTARAELKTMLMSIDDRKVAIQLAADTQWPHSDAANAAIRREFGLSPKAAFLA